MLVGGAHFSSDTQHNSQLLQPHNTFTHQPTYPFLYRVCLCRGQYVMTAKNMLQPIRMATEDYSGAHNEEQPSAQNAQQKRECNTPLIRRQHSMRSAVLGKTHNKVDTPKSIENFIAGLGRCRL